MKSLTLYLEFPLSFNFGPEMKCLRFLIIVFFCSAYDVFRIFHERHLRRICQKEHRYCYDRGCAFILFYNMHDSFMWVIEYIKFEGLRPEYCKLIFLFHV